MKSFISTMNLYLYMKKFYPNSRLVWIHINNEIGTGIWEFIEFQNEDIPFINNEKLEIVHL